MQAALRQIPQQIDAALREPWQIRAMAVVDAILVNLLILGAARLVLGELPRATVSDEVQSVGIAAVFFATVMAGLVAGLSLGLLERLTARAKGIWTAVAVVGLLLSLLGPLGGGENTGSTIALTCMHLGAAGTLIPLMRRSV